MSSRLKRLCVDVVYAVVYAYCVCVHLVCVVGLSVLMCA